MSHVCSQYYLTIQLPSNILPQSPTCYQKRKHVLTSSCTWTRAIRTRIVLQGTYSMLRPPSHPVISHVWDPRHTELSVLQCCHSRLHWRPQGTASSAPRLTKLPSPFILTHARVSLGITLSMTCFLPISLPVLFWPLPLPTAISWRLEHKEHLLLEHSFSSCTTANDEF